VHYNPADGTDAHILIELDELHEREDPSYVSKEQLGDTASDPSSAGGNWGFIMRSTLARDPSPSDERRYLPSTLRRVVKARMTLANWGELAVSVPR
jgi:hypothetical protein